MRPADVDQRLHVTSGSVANALQMVAGFVVLAFITRIVTPTEVGLYFFLLSIIKIGDGPLTGAISGATKRLSEDDSPRNELITLVLILIVVGSLLFSILINALAGITTEIQNPVLASVLFFGLLSSKSLLTLYTGTGLVATKTWIEFGRTVLRAVLWVLLGVLGFGVVGLIAGTVIASLLAVPVVLVLFRWIPRLPSRRTMTSVWTFARYSSISDVVYKIADNVDRIIVGVLIGSSAVASYEVTLRVTLPALLMTSVLSPLLMSRVSDLDSRMLDVSGEITKTVSFASLLSFPLFFGVVAIGDPLITTPFGSEYAGLGGLLVLVASYRVIESQASPLGSVVSGMDMPDRLLTVSSLSAFVNVVLSVVGAVEFGLVGVIGGTIIAACLRWLLFTITIYRRVSVVPVTRPMLNQLMAGVVMGVVLLTVKIAIGIQGWTGVVGHVGLGAGLYFGCLYLMDTAFRQVMRDTANQLV